MFNKEHLLTTHWHQIDIGEATETLGVDPKQGLTEEEVEQRQAYFGLNEIEEVAGKSIWKMLWAQLTDTMVLVLLAAALISVLISDWKDAIAIAAIVSLNAVIGLVQEYRAEQAMAALRKMASPIVKVMRHGQPQEVDTRHLVPGDVIFLEAGGKVPADARLIESINLRVEEASLTGESEPVDKIIDPLSGENIPLGDRKNMVHMGTVATYGRGLAVVIKTGMNTELGRIAGMIQTVEDDRSPLQKRMSRMGRTLAIIALSIVSLVFSLGLLRGEDAGEMLLTAIAMAVAAVPEGLPAVVAIALALGAQRMLKRQSLIRKLPAVETLGSVTVICSDKTGTLTANEMQLKVLDVAGRTRELDWRPGQDTPDLNFEMLETALQLLVLGGALNNDAQLVTDPQSPGDYLVLGDPTEGALVSAAANLGLTKPMLEVTFPRVGEVPFSSERKRMSTIHQFGPQAELYMPLFSSIGAGQTNTHHTFTKGAVDAMLEICDRVYVDNQVVVLDSDWRERIERASESMAAEGLRVLGLGYKLLQPGANVKVDERIEQALVFIGLYGMMDPPRPEALDAVQISQAAGIRTIMITGDHPLTAERIAREVGIAGEGHTITGQKLDSLSDKELVELVAHTNVFARVAPEHKLRIVSALQARGEIVAMTGDGVNDAPALRKADIGVAMGITGTDVSKEASDMVLLDDNFATIVSAVREGRTIFSNIRKFIKYTMTSNAGEIIVMLLAPIFGMPLPLTALQILWINLVTDGFPGLALSTEPTEQDTMERPPIDPAARILSGGLGWHIILVGLLMGLVSLGIGIWAWSIDNPAWTTMVFTTLTLSQMGHVLAIRSDYRSLFEQGLFSNKPMLAAVMTTFFLQMLITYWKPMNEIFETIPLSPMELAISLSLSMIVFLAVEVEKSFKRRKRARAIY